MGRPSTPRSYLKMGHNEMEIKFSNFYIRGQVLESRILEFRIQKGFSLNEVYKNKSFKCTKA